MFPIGHAAVGCIAYALLSAPTQSNLRMRSLGIALFGSQVPDIVDKPLAYYGLLPSGRSLGHSLLFAMLIIGVLFVLTSDTKRNTAIAFAVGYIAHPLADAHQALLSAAIPGYLLWPVTRAPRYGTEIAPWIRLVQVYGNPEIGIQTLVLVAGAAVLIGIRSMDEHGWTPARDWFLRE